MIVITILLAINNLVFADPTVIAGSSGESSPPFMENSFWGMTASTERAFPFAVVSGGPYRVEELKVAAYHYERLEGSLAYFSINLDEDGHPGQAIATFETTGITTTQQVVTLQITQKTILYSDTPYWLVGGTPQGQVNWNLASNVFGTSAYRENEGEWVIRSNTNVSAFAILGSPVPKPATLLLLGLGAVLLLLALGAVMLRRKRKT